MGSHVVTCIYCLLVLLEGSLDVCVVEEVVPRLPDRLGVLGSKGKVVINQSLDQSYKCIPSVLPTSGCAAMSGGGSTSSSSEPPLLEP